MAFSRGRRTEDDGAARDFEAGAYQIFECGLPRGGVKERIGCHTTRKTFGYHFYKQYHDLVKLQRILGHSSTRDTLVYIGMIDDEVDESLRHFKLLGGVRRQKRP